MRRLHFVSMECSASCFSSLAKSILNQENPNWKWFIDEATLQHFDASSEFPNVLKDERISVGDFSRETNVRYLLEELEISSSWGFAFLRPEVSLSPRFVARAEREFVKVDAAGKTLDLFYSDVQLTEEDGQKCGIWRRPRYSPERLLHNDYVSGATVIGSEILKNLSTELSFQHCDLEQLALMDVIVNGTTQCHVRDPLVTLPKRVAAEITTGGSLHRTQFAVESAKKMNMSFSVDPGPTGNWTLRRRPREGVSVSIVVPTRGDTKCIWGIETDLIENVVESLFTKTSTDNFEVIVVHDVNGTYDRHVQSFEEYGARVRVFPFARPFNFSEKCNVGVAESSSNVVVLLNDDVEVIDPRWLEHLVGYLESPEVGMVGPALLLDNGLIQSAGHVNQPLPTNYFAGKPLGIKEFPECLDVPCEVSGLTAACVAMRREVFEEVGGLCEELPNNFNDVDLCAKVQQTGRSLIWTPMARLYHFETLTRTTTVTEEEIKFIKARWGRTFGDDPWRSRVD